MADPNFGNIVVGVTLLVGVVVSVIGLIVVTPFTLLGYWAHGAPDVGPQTSPSHSAGSTLVKVGLVVAIGLLLLGWLQGLASTINPALTSPTPTSRSTPATLPDQASRPAATPIARRPVTQITTPYVPVLPQSIRGYATLNEFVADARTNLNDYWLHVPFPASLPYVAPEVVLVRPGQPAGPANCAPQSTSFYCPLNRTIYLYEPGLQSGNAWAGYAGMYVIVAHEWTHHVQLILGVPQVRPQLELQADCGSGLFVAAGWPHMSESDLQPVRRMLNSFSDVQHGPPAQRLAAFDAGYQHGADDACGLPLA